MSCLILSFSCNIGGIDRSINQSWSHLLSCLFVRLFVFETTKKDEWTSTTTCIISYHFDRPFSSIELSTYFLFDWLMISIHSSLDPYFTHSLQIIISNVLNWIARRQASNQGRTIRNRTVPYRAVQYAVRWAGISDQSKQASKRRRVVFCLPRS